MACTYKHTTKRIRKTPEEVRHAVQLALDGNISARAAATDLGFSRSESQRHGQAAKKLRAENVATYTFIANGLAISALTEEQEEKLAAYLIKAICSKIEIKLPIYSTTEMAGRNWLLGFRDWHPTLSLRCPEVTSFGKVSSFIKFTVGKFFENLRCLLKKRDFAPKNINNTTMMDCYGEIIIKTMSTLMSLLKRNLTIPPHCSHRLQPLDVSVYKPFKAAASWMTNNARRAATVYDVAGIACQEFNQAKNRSNILSGFAKTGID
ncbi:hypothetical protein ILUMI_08851 [Ignelater luminosus]|uniref:Uncharacterized protein n=1 Tax=Ignelater luminosus TaxID=2038154 RepID=A0A8K0D147_IGNLU|nr:hypothetical protein ILUMI_08851 [Ignelater luminosus]